MVARIYKILLFDEAFDEALCNRYHEKWRSVFFCLLVKHWNKFLEHINAAYQSKLYKKKDSQTNKDNLTKIVAIVFLLSHAAKFNFFIFATIYHILEWIWFV